MPQETVHSQVVSGLVCPHCSYSIDGLPQAQCPECGRAFDPSQLTATGTASVESFVKLAPPVWLNVVYTVGAASFFLLLCSVNGSTADSCIGPWALVVLVPALTWMAFFGAHLIARFILLIMGRPQPRWAWR